MNKGQGPAVDRLQQKALSAPSIDQNRLFSLPAPITKLLYELSSIHSILVWQCMNFSLQETTKLLLDFQANRVH